jgi:hypothetical protein
MSSKQALNDNIMLSSLIDLKHHKYLIILIKVLKAAVDPVLPGRGALERALIVIQHYRLSEST